MMVSLSPAGLSIDRHDGTFLDVLVGMWNGNAPRFDRMFELAMIALYGDMPPAVFFQHFNNFAAIAFHFKFLCGSAYTTRPQRSRGYV